MDPQGAVKDVPDVSAATAVSVTTKGKSTRSGAELGPRRLKADPRRSACPRRANNVVTWIVGP